MRARRSRRCGRTSGSHGGDVELIGGRRRRRARCGMAGSCDGCPSSAATLKLAIEDAIRRPAPDVEAVEAEGVAERRARAAADRLAAPRRARRRGTAWTTAGALPQLARRRHAARRTSPGSRCCSCGSTGRCYAYRAGVPGVRRLARRRGARAAPRARAAPAAARLRRPARGPLPRRPELHLEPVPLLVDGPGLVQVALGRRWRDGRPSRRLHRARAAAQRSPRRRSRRRRSTATSAARRSPPTTAICSTSQRRAAVRVPGRARSSSTAARRAAATTGSCPTGAAADRRLRARRRALGRRCACRSTSRSSSAARAGGRVVAFYPSPMGATESLLELSAWGELEAREPGPGGDAARRRGAARQPREGCARALARARRPLLRARRPHPHALEGVRRGHRGVERDRPVLLRARTRRQDGHEGRCRPDNQVNRTADRETNQGKE